MKKLIIAIALFVVLGNASAQSTREQIKARSENVKASHKELNEKASKDARKEAKSMVKEGWKVTPGALPIEKQLDKSYMMQYEQDEDGYPKYIMGEAMSTAQNYDAAKMQALELAKQNMAGQIQTEVTALIENTVANSQLEPEEAATITKSVMASKNLISQSIGRVVPIVEVYRTLPNKNKDVLVRIAYSSDMARKAALNAVKKSLANEGEALHGKLDKLLEK